ncbi:MAG: hypothetical protein RLY47_553 [Candidatus Parcubacteria bacterium]|jgi:hypothetical protein
MIRTCAAWFLVGVALIAAQSFVPPAQAAFSPYINYQGKLADDTGTPVADDLYNMEFKLYDDPVAGSVVWTETRTGADKVQVTDGLFSILLGEVAAIDGVNFNQPLYLSVQIGGVGTPSWDGEMTPRRDISSVPTAFLAGTALALDATNATSTNATTTNLYVSGAVGVGTSTPITSMLAIKGSASKANIFEIASSTDANIFMVTGTGRVGIGTSSPYARLSVAGDIALTGGLYDSGASLGSNGMVLLSTGTGVDWVATSTLGITGGSGSLQSAYDGGATIQTAAGSPVVITETAAALSSSHNLLQLTANPGIGGDYSGDALQITLDGVDANSNTGIGLHMVIDQSQATGNPIVIEDDAGFDLLALSQTGGLTVGSATQRLDSTIYGDLVTKGHTIQRSLTGILDIFIYDTTRDSDGGAWRTNGLTSGTSWYTETKDDGPNDACVIGTDDRCGSSVFPRKAILVTTVESLYIFDAKDNSLWMEFTQDGTYALGASTGNPSGVGAVNGTVYVGTNGTGTGLYAFDFISDRMYRYNATNRVQADTKIGTRNTATTYATDAQTSLAILDAVVNDVSAALQYGSSEGTTNVAGAIPLDSGAGPLRGVVLIAAATDTGISVIHPDTQEVINYSDATNDDYNTVHMTTRGRMYAANETRAQLETWRNVDRDVTAETNGTPDRWYDETITAGTITGGQVPAIATSPATIAVAERASLAREATATGNNDSGDVVLFGTSQGFAEIHDSGGNLGAAAWTRFVSTATATPLMVGGVKSLFLFEEAAGATDALSSLGSGANILQSFNTPTFGTSGVRGTAVDLNGTSQFFCTDGTGNDGVCDNDTDYNMAATSWTVSAWLKHDLTPAGIDTVFEKCWVPATPSAGTGCAWGGMNASGQYIMGVDDDATWTVGSSMDDLTTAAGPSYADGLWHHVVFTNTDTDICVYVDGKQVTCDSTLAATATLDTSAVTLTVGASCAGANCVTGANFFAGEMDDLAFSMGGGTTASGVTQAGAASLFLDGRAHLLQKRIAVTNATAFSATTIGDSGETWIPNEFVGRIVEITGDLGAGQTRRVVSNTATVLTVDTAWGTTPDATSDFSIDSERLFGTSNNVTSVAVDATTYVLGQARRMYVGTSDGSDGGGVNVFSNIGSGSILTDVIHTQGTVPNDDFGTAWSGSDADDIQALAMTSGTLVFGTQAFIRAQENDVSLEQQQQTVLGALNGIQQELVAHYLFGSTNNLLGVGNGADLAELYVSAEPLLAGDIVAVDQNVTSGVLRSTKAYQKNVIGIVATRPGLVLGPAEASSYPIALVGRVPVNVTTDNGVIRMGDRITTSSLSGYGMRATQAGRVLGTALESMKVENLDACPGDDESSPRRCGQVMVFVNLVDYSGMSVSLLAQEAGDITTAEIIPAACIDADGATTTPSSGGVCGEDETLVPSYELSVVSETGSYELLDGLEVLSFLKENGDTVLDSEMFTGRLSAGLDIITPHIFTDTLSVSAIESSSDDGGIALMLGDNGRFEIRRKGDPEDPSATSSVLVTFDAEGNAVFSGTISAQGLTFGSDVATHTATTSSPALFIASIEEGVADALVVIRSALVRSFAAVTLYAENMFASTITIIPEGRIAVPSGRDQISGTARIPSGSSSVDVENASVLATSKIFITPLSVSEHPLVVTLKRPGIGFTISLFAPAALDIYFDWLLVDSYPTDDTTTSVPGETVVEDIPIEETPLEEAPPDTSDEPEVEPSSEELEVETAPEPVVEEGTEPEVEELPQEPEAAVEPPADLPAQMGESEPKIEAEPTPEPEPEEEPEQENVEPEPTEEPTT